MFATKQIANLQMNSIFSHLGSGGKTQSISTEPVIIHSSNISSSAAQDTALTVKKYTDFNWDGEQDWLSFTVQKYMETLLSSPLVVAETLLNAQHHKRLSKGEYDEPAIAYESIQEGSLESIHENLKHSSNSTLKYLPRIDGDVVATSRLLVELKQEGWTANFKGHLSHFAYRSLFSISQPFLEESLNDLFDVFEDTHPATLACSHVILGAVLSPLELVRTRLILQSLNPRRKKYFGPFHAFYLIAKEEKNSSLFSTFYNYKNLVPCILANAISPLVRFASTSFIEEHFGLHHSLNPIMYKLSQILFLGVEALFTCPLELARTRLYSQSMAAKKSKKSSSPQAELPVIPFDTCIQLPQREYRGTIDVISDVITNEGGKGIQRPKNVKVSIDDWQNIYGGGAKSKDESPELIDSISGFAKGVSSLFRSWWPRYLILVIRFVSEEINKEDDWL